MSRSTQAGTRTRPPGRRETRRKWGFTSGTGVPSMASRPRTTRTPSASRSMPTVASIDRVGLRPMPGRLRGKMPVSGMSSAVARPPDDGRAGIRTGSGASGTRRPRARTARSPAARPGAPAAGVVSGTTCSAAARPRLRIATRSGRIADGWTSGTGAGGGSRADDRLEGRPWPPVRPRHGGRESLGPRRRAVSAVGLRRRPESDRAGPGVVRRQRRFASRSRGRGPPTPAAGPPQGRAPREARRERPQHTCMRRGAQEIRAPQTSSAASDLGGPVAPTPRSGPRSTGGPAPDSAPGRIAARRSRRPSRSQRTAGSLHPRADVRQAHELRPTQQQAARKGR